MEINSASNPAYDRSLDRTAVARTSTPPASGSNNGAADDAVEPSTKVELSQDGKQAAAASKEDTPAAATPSAGAQAQAAAPKDAATAGSDASDKDGSGKETSSPVKSFAYGAVGLVPPEQKKAEKPDEYYNAGRIMVAALTVGTLISLLV